MSEAAQRVKFIKGLDSKSFKAVAIQMLMKARTNEIEPFILEQADATRLVPAWNIVSQTFPAKPAPPAEGATAAVRERYKDELKEWKKLWAALASLTTFMTGAISEGLARTLFPAGDIEIQTAFEILKALKKEFNTMDVATKDNKLKKLTEKFDPETTTLEEHRAKVLKIVEELQEGGYVMTPSVALEYLEESLSNKEGEWIMFNELKPTFRTINTTIESQTMDKLFTLLINYEKSTKRKQPQERCSREQPQQQQQQPHQEKLRDAIPKRNGER